MKPEQAVAKGQEQSAGSLEVGQSPELFSGITLDLVVRTAFELQKLWGREGFEEARAEGRTDQYFYQLGTEAIRLLFGWQQLLTTEKKAGCVGRKSGWMARRRGDEIRQQQQEAQELRAELTQRVQMLESLVQKVETAPVPFNKAAKDLLPKTKTKAKEAVPDLIVYLNTLAKGLTPEHPLVPIIQECLQEKTIPKGLIPDLKSFFESLHKLVVSEKRKASGAKGGRHRVRSLEQRKDLRQSRAA